MFSKKALKAELPIFKVKCLDNNDDNSHNYSYYYCYEYMVPYWVSDTHLLFKHIYLTLTKKAKGGKYFRKKVVDRKLTIGFHVLHLVGNCDRDALEKIG